MRAVRRLGLVVALALVAAAGASAQPPANRLELLKQALPGQLDSVTLTHFQRIAELVAGRRLPSIYPAREFVEAGGLMAYGTIEQASKFELLINLRAARALGVTLRQTLTLRADHLIR